MGQAATNTKVGVINIQQAVYSTKDGRAAVEQLQMKFEPRKRELDKKNSEIQQLQDQFRKSQNTASEEQRAKLARDIDQKQRSLQRDTEDAQAEFDQERERALGDLGGRIMQVIDKYARDNQYTLILDISSQQSPVLYMANGIDITAEVVKLYDANAPAAPAAGAPSGSGATSTTPPATAEPKPTAPKPAITPAPKPPAAKP